MRIAVCLKQVPDTETKIKINSDATGIETTGVKWIISPYDEHAIEEALKTKQAQSGEVIVFTLGPKSRVGDALRTALAMGCDEAVLVDAPENLDNFSTAKALAAALEKEGQFDLILTGKLAIDDNASAVSQMIAEFLKIPHSTVVSKMETEASSTTIEREVEGGTREIVQLTFPAVVGANKGLNMPRYASLPGIMKAKKKQIKEYDLAGLGINDGDSKVSYSNLELPAEKPPATMILASVRSSFWLSPLTTSLTVVLRSVAGRSNFSIAGASPETSATGSWLARIRTIRVSQFLKLTVAVHLPE